MNKTISPASVRPMVTRVIWLLAAALRMPVDRGQVVDTVRRLRVMLGRIAIGEGLHLGPLRIVNRRVLLAVPLEHLVHVAVAALLGQHARSMHEQFLLLDEILAVETPDARMHVGVHPNRVARTGLDAQPAVDAAQRVDLVAHRELLDVRIGRLARLYIYALRRTRSRAQKACRASHRRILAQRQTVATAKIVGIALALL